MITILSHRLIDNPTFLTGVFTIAGTVIGAILAGVTGYIIAARTAKIENQRQLRELGFKIALANFERQTKECQQIADATGINQNMLSLPVFVAEGMKFSEFVADPTLSPEEIGKRILAIAEFTRIVWANGRKH